MEIGYDYEAKVLMQISDTSGKTWSNSYESSTGKAGQDKKRVIWRRLGQKRDCILRFIITDAVPIRILGLYVRTA